MNRATGMTNPHTVGVQLRVLSQAICLLLVAVALTATSSAAAIAPAPALVGNINRVSSSGIATASSPMVAIGNTLYFIANDGLSGWELWKSDGTATGTALVKDSIPGQSNPFDPQGAPKLVVAGTKLFFILNDGVTGWELWQSDGTGVGTDLVKDICPGACPASLDTAPAWLVADGDALYFSAVDGVDGQELWRSDGTAAGTNMVEDIYPGEGGSFPSELTMVGTTLFFLANGRELWKSDGTAASTVLVKNIDLDQIHNSPSEQLTDVNGTLFFVANSQAGADLWKSDGTPSGTVPIKHFSIGPHELTNVHGTLYFSGNDPDLGIELWKSDGTPEGTILVNDMRPGSLSSDLYDLTDVSGTLFFMNQWELWKSDGTRNGTVLVKPFPPGDSWPVNGMVSAKGSAYFAADDQVNGRELWRSDGTTQGTTLVKDIWPGPIGSEPSPVVEVGGMLYFSVDDGVHGRELWKSEDGLSGPVLVKDIWAGDNGSSPDYLTDVNGTLFFSADDGSRNRELWKSGGSPEGTNAVRTGAPGWDLSYPEDLTNLDGTVFFKAPSGWGMDLWKSDGTPAGTVPIYSTVGAYRSQIADLTNVGGTLFFSVGHMFLTQGWGELLAYDGSAERITQVKVFSPPYHSFPTPYRLTNVNGTLFFFVDYSWERRSELWTSDGTPEGTVLISTMTSAPYGKHIVEAKDHGPVLFFSVEGPLEGPIGSSELWKSDGTANGTVLLKGGFALAPSNLTVMGEKVYFRAAQSVGNHGLWQTDGTPAGTTPLKDGFLSPPSSLLDLDGVLLFGGDDGVHGEELWKTDGTAAGTALLKDLALGPDSSAPQSLTLYRQQDRLALFVASNGVSGRELWLTDGTEAGTIQLQDIAAGSLSSNPSMLTFSGSHIFLHATDAMHGEELWAIPGAQINYRPTVYNTTVDTDIMQPVNGTLRASDVDQSILNYSIDSNGRKGVAAIVDAARGTFTYIPNWGAYGRDYFTVKVEDNQGGLNVGRVTVNINGSVTYIPAVLRP